METFEIIEEGVHLCATLIRMGSDLLFAVTGGESPHIGSVSVSVARQSLADPERASSTTSTINLTGHKDNIVGDRMSAHFSTALKTNVFLACGIHYDNIGPKGIDHVLELSEKLTDQIIQAILSER